MAGAGEGGAPQVPAELLAEEEGATAAMAALTIAIEGLRNQVVRQEERAERIIRDHGIALTTLEGRMREEMRQRLEGAAEAARAEQEEREAAAKSGMPRSRAPEFDDRKLKVKAYDGTKSLWRDFEYTMAGFVARESPKLAEAMVKVVDLPDELQPSGCPGHRPRAGRQVQVARAEQPRAREQGQYPRENL